MIDFIFSNTWILLKAASVLFIMKLVFPKLSYQVKSSLLIAIGVFVLFVWQFIHSFSNEEVDFISPFYALLSLWYIYSGSRDVPFRTMTGVFSRFGSKLIGYLRAGSKGWVDPLFEYTTVGTNGELNTSIDLQAIKVHIEETPLMQTKTRGIQVRIKDITLMLKFIESEEGVMQMISIEGGTKVIKERIIGFCDEFFLDEIGEKLPVDIDTDKGNILENLSEKLKKEVNHFCDTNNYPYRIPSNSRITIGDTELQPEYYQALAKEAFAKLEGKAEKVKADTLRKRIQDMGKNLLPNGNPKEQTECALIALGITKKEIKEQKYDIDGNISVLLVKLAEILASKK